MVLRKVSIKKSYLQDQWFVTQKLGFDTVYVCVQNLMILALAIPEISLRAPKFKVGHVTRTTPILKIICPPYSGT